MCLETKAGYGYDLCWGAQTVKLNFQFYKMGTEATRCEKGKELEAAHMSAGEQRAHQRPCMALGKPGSCLWLLAFSGSS